MAQYLFKNIQKILERRVSLTGSSVLSSPVDQYLSAKDKEINSGSSLDGSPGENLVQNKQSPILHEVGSAQSGNTSS